MPCAKTISKVGDYAIFSFEIFSPGRRSGKRRLQFCEIALHYGKVIHVFSA